MKQHTNTKEFDIIARYFQKPASSQDDIVVHTGDDCAIVNVPHDQSLAVSIDTLVAGIHFPLNTRACDIGHKALAVSLSDLAACGAAPRWITAALTLPELDETWLTDFCEGFFALAKRFDVAVIGGDLTRGPLSITVQAHGFVKKNALLLRSHAKPGDHVFVSGTLGDAALALKTNDPDCLEKLNRPEPQVALGLQLHGIAHAVIDLSDGLMSDLKHIIIDSSVGAIIDVDTIPLSRALKKQTRDTALHCALNGGDDYELCFTVPPKNLPALNNITCTDITHIGIITDTLTLQLIDGDKQPYSFDEQGFKHFE